MLKFGSNIIFLTTGIHFYASATVEKCCWRHSVFRSVRSWVRESLHPRNLVNTISQKPVKGILPDFGHRCIWVHRCADWFWGQKVKVTAGGGITVDASPSSSIYFSWWLAVTTWHVLCCCINSSVTNVHKLLT